jgi:hypothetical protein
MSQVPSWVWLIAGILIVTMTMEQNPKLGGLLLIVVVLGWLFVNRRLIGGVA